MQLTCEQPARCRTPQTTDTRNLSSLIQGLPFFQDLTPEQIQALTEIARYRRFRANELIFHHGHLANRFYVVSAGSVAIEARAEDGHVVRFQTAEPGELIGWSWLFSDYIQQLQARVLKPTEVLYFTGEELRALCDRDHDLGYELFRRLSNVMMRRLQHTRQELLKATPVSQPATVEWHPGQH